MNHLFVKYLFRNSSTSPHTMKTTIDIKEVWLGLNKTLFTNKKIKIGLGSQVTVCQPLV